MLLSRADVSRAEEPSPDEPINMSLLESVMVDSMSVSLLESPDLSVC